MENVENNDQAGGGSETVFMTPDQFIDYLLQIIKDQGKQLDDQKAQYESQLANQTSENERLKSKIKNQSLAIEILVKQLRHSEIERETLARTVIYVKTDGSVHEGTYKSLQRKVQQNAAAAEEQVSMEQLPQLQEQQVDTNQGEERNGGSYVSSSSFGNQTHNG